MKKLIQGLLILLTVLYMSLFLACLNDVLDMGLGKVESSGFIVLCLFMAFLFFAIAYLLLRKIAVVKWVLLVLFLLIMSDTIYMYLFIIKYPADALLYTGIAAVFLMQIFFRIKKIPDGKK